MYVPRYFGLAEHSGQHDLIERYRFATLVATAEGRFEAAHIPFMLDREAGPHGTLRAHVARANPIWRALDGAGEVLVIFQGPAAYISPDWYVTRGQVPTWNYSAVHAYGPARLMEAGELESLLTDLSAAEEGKLLPKQPWTIAKLAPPAFAAMLKAIVGIVVPIARIEGKAKLSQNRSAADMEEAARALRATGDAQAVALAQLMEDELAART
jgi:transcriptional regulator